MQDFEIGDKFINGGAIMRKHKELRLATERATTEEIDALKWAVQWIESYPARPDAITFIHEDAFEEYVRDDADDQFGVVGSWLVIDWTATANAVQQDYKQIDIGEETYWVRA